MRTHPFLLPLFFSALVLAAPAAAQDVAVVATEAEEETVLDTPEYGPFEITDQTLGQYMWVNRLVVVFADTDRDPAFLRQMELLRGRPSALEDRDIVVLTDTDPLARSAIRIKLRPRGFAMVIVDKDGKVVTRKPSPWDIREIGRAIDKTPLRQQELRDARDAEADARGFPR
jgi:hypothetical protein